MKSLRYLLVALVFISLTAKAELSEYDFPLKNPFLATLTAAANGTKMKYKKVSIEIREDRRNVPLLEGRHLIAVGLFQQKGPAPVIFTIAGLGGSGTTGTSLMIAEILYKLGYTVITLPNPFSWQYTLGVSESATPGYMARDSKEYYLFMKKVTSYLTKSDGLQASSYSVVGFSLGGLFSTYLAKEDSSKMAFNFKKTVLINPAIDLKYGLQLIDSFYEGGRALSEARKAKVSDLLITVGSDLINAPLSTQTLRKVMPEVSQFTDNDMKWLIGKAFRETLRDVIYTSQQVHNTGLLKVPATSGRQTMRINEALGFSYYEYINRLVLPTVKNSQVEELINQTSLYSLQAYIETNPNIYVIENEDDFIVNQNDIQFLKQTFTSRLKLYPHGGHMGNLWYSQNQSDLGILFPKVN